MKYLKQDSLIDGENAFATPSIEVANHKSNMYADAKTWNPFKGCRFDCAYCLPSFQRQAKRQKHNCTKCYNYVPHFHPERLSKIPNSDIVFACGNADISFASRSQMNQIIDAIIKNNQTARKKKTFYLQSKKPSCLAPYINRLPDNVILLTTLETNRDAGYGKISKAPVPSKRYRQFLALKHPRKAVTIEPVMDFDVEEFSKWILSIKPEYVWLGLDSKGCGLPEPSPAKLKLFTGILVANGMRIRGKSLRKLNLPGVNK